MHYLTCQICSTIVENPVSVCGLAEHMICRSDFEQMAGDRRCPICRKEASGGTFRRLDFHQLQLQQTELTCKACGPGVTIQYSAAYRHRHLHTTSQINEREVALLKDRLAHQGEKLRASEEKLDMLSQMVTTSCAAIRDRTGYLESQIAGEPSGGAAALLLPVRGRSRSPRRADASE